MGNSLIKQKTVVEIMERETNYKLKNYEKTLYERFNYEIVTEAKRGRRYAHMFTDMDGFLSEVGCGGYDEREDFNTHDKDDMRCVDIKKRMWVIVNRVVNYTENKRGVKSNGSNKFVW
jgi:hypothetical protein